ncbi:MAG: phosphoenolpyruvate--protein phosphotransferase [Wenzhouxiangellaceae bacterium]|nr:phosphoenolpyruvate--protein phosphotransferase [Wenzhouxiangellaceae bacterium]
MILSLSGTGVSDGIAIGQAHLLSSGELELPEYEIDERGVENEIRRLREAAERCEQSLLKMERDVAGVRDGPAGELLQAHRMMVRDEMLIGESCRRIREDRINAEWALDQQAAGLRRELKQAGDEYLALRVEDLDQVVRLLQQQLAEQPMSALDERIPHQLDETIVLADQLSPAELVALHRRKVAGLVTEHGSVWSHAAIIARALGIPMVVAVHRSVRLLREGEPVILDSHYGVVLATRDERLHGHYAEKMAASRRNRRQLERYLSEPDRTRDGVRFRLFCNAEMGPELQRCRESAVAGVGLMRTEFVFARHELGDEQGQYEVYREAVDILAGKPLTIRTLDAGGDKLPDELKRLRGPNPALGLRGIRMSLAVQEYFQTQIRAILRASVHGPVRILLPMLTRLDEVEQARDLIAHCRGQLVARGIRPDPETQVGGMIETPAAALLVRAMAARLDFISIGSNDLIQYLLAVDRQDELVSHLFDPAHRAVIETLARIVRGAHAAGRGVQICGELAGDPAYAPLLLGLGVTEFSLPPAQLAAVKATLVRTDAGKCRERVERFLADGDEGGSGEELIRDLAEFVR